MKKFTLIIALTLTIQSIVLSQSCLPEGITFKTQDEIDNFQTNYPGCTEIEGGVKIGDWEYYDITNLEGLDVITSIGGYLLIGSYDSHTLLTNLSGLDNLSFVEGELRIMNNDSLMTLSGLNNLSTISGDLKIQSNSSLTHIIGFNNLISTGGSFDIGPSASLTSVSGFNSLTTVGGDLSVGENPILSDLEWLSEINSVNGDIVIIFNNEITSLTGLDNIDAGTITNLHIYDNPILSTCEVESICDFLATPNGEIVIHDNAPGCNSQGEIEEACEALAIPVNNLNYEFSIHPNPATNKLYITSNNGLKIELVNIYNQLGQKVLHRNEIREYINISTLGQGIYIIELTSNELKIREKLVIKE